MPDTTTPDQVAAFLDEIRDLVTARNALPPTASVEIDVADFGLASHVLPLVAVVDRVMRLASTWESQTGAATVTATVFRECAEQIRVEVAASLLGSQTAPAGEGP
jgi:hypothetical protein